LAAGLLPALAARGSPPDRYLIMELSPELAARQHACMRDHVPEFIERVHWIDALPEHFNGIVLANEVLDAMPVHRFCIADDGNVRELFVVASGEGFEVRAGEPMSSGLEAAVERIRTQAIADGRTLEPGYCSEINLRFFPWVKAVAASLTAGMVLLIDYGYPRTEYYLPERAGGTLMCHYRHRAHTEVFTHIGLQDITAHVDFSALALAGTEAGLTLAGYTTQANFLLGCGLDRFVAESAGDPTAVLDLTAGVKQLLLPSAMGERFQVLALAKDLAPPEPQGWCGFSTRDLSGRL
ncbi:MAG: SAM-dependent methyltransferase, partial [Thiohalocapsa sp.]